MGSDVGQICLTGSKYRDHSILNALVCEKELSHMGKTTEISIWCVRKMYLVWGISTNRVFIGILTLCLGKYIKLTQGQKLHYLLLIFPNDIFNA